MKHPNMRYMIFGLKVLIGVCVGLILAGLTIYMLNKNVQEKTFFTSDELLKLALMFLLLMPVYILSVMAFGYFRIRNYSMGIWTLGILYFTFAGTYILFLLNFSGIG